MDANQPAIELTINDFVDELVIALVNARIYQEDHPRVREPIAEVRRLLPELCSQHDRSKIEIRVADNQLVFEERPLIGASLSAPRLINAVRDWSAGGIAFERDASEDDLHSALVVLMARAEEDAKRSHDRANEQLARRNCRGVRLLAPFDDEQAPQDREQRANVPISLYQNIVDLLQDTTISLCHGGLIQFEKSQSCIEQVLRNLQSDPAGLFSAVRYERYDAYTFGHSIRVCILALNFAKTLTSDQALLNRVGVAALLHDVGKAKVPFDVLHCRTRLSPEQRREMEKHPTHGAEILLDHHDCDPMAYGAAFGHHIGNDGQGYPKLLRSAPVSLVTKIVKICDVYEALTAERPYKPSMSPVRAFRIMIGMGDAFDRSLLRRFIVANGVFPSGSQVRLSNGEQARVLQQTGDLLRPVVEIHTNAHGEALDAERRELVDLSQPHGRVQGCSVELVLRNADLVEQSDL
jgi:HD-GYP domain-containing protein (c-di-GMP phosphodiesterase class II)